MDTKIHGDGDHQKKKSYSAPSQIKAKNTYYTRTSKIKYIYIYFVNKYFHYK
jgi:hypothetical protein